MQQFSFSTYLVDDSNRAAYEVCHEIADLKPVQPQPLILLGDSGCGKTHLLYSIVNRVRSASANSGLAFVRATDFPEPVRALIHDPSPLDRSPHAILLVDDLELFGDRAEDLVAVVDLFISRQQYVVIATSLHPGRLSDVPEGLLAILARAQIVEIAAEESASRAHSIDRRIREESEIIIDLQRKEIEGLRLELAELGNRPAPVLDDSRIRELESEIGVLMVEIEDTRSKFDAASEELEGLRAENALMTVSQREVGPLRQKIEELRTLRDEALPRQAEGGGTSETEETLRVELAQAKAEGLRAQAEANELLDRAEALLSEVQKSRERFVQAQSAQSRQMRELKAIEAMLAEAGLSIEGVKRGDPASLIHLELPTAQKDEVRRRLEDAIRARDELQEQSQMLRTELDAVQKAYREFQVTMIEAAKELDLVRAKQSQLRRENDQLSDGLVESRQRGASLEQDLAASRRERDEFADAVDTARFERETLRSELTRASEEEARRHHEEIEVLRREFLAGLEAAQAQCSEIEAKLSAITIELDQVRQMNQGVVSKVRSLQTVVEAEESDTRLGDVPAEPEPFNENAVTSDEESGDEDRELRDAIERLRAYGASHSFYGADAQVQPPHTPRIRPYDPPSFDEVAKVESREAPLEPLAPMARPDFGEAQTVVPQTGSSIHHVEQLGETTNVIGASPRLEILRDRAEGEDPSI